MLVVKMRPSRPYHITFRPKLMAFNLHKLPAELRACIFQHYLETERSSAPYRTPPLIIALRPDSILYHETLDIFYRISTFRLTAENERLLMARMSPRLLRTIRSLNVKFSYVRNASVFTSVSLDTCLVMLILNRRGFEPVELPTKPDISFKSHPIWSASNVRTLELDLECVHPAKAVKFAKFCLTRLLNVQSLTVRMTHRIQLSQPAIINENGNIRFLHELPTGLRDLVLGESNDQLPPSVQAINAATQTRCIQNPSDPEIFTWSAGSCRSLTWTDEQHFRSMPYEIYIKGNSPNVIPWGRKAFVINQPCTMIGVLTLTHQVFMSLHCRTSSVGLNARYFFSYCSLGNCPCLAYRLSSDGTLFVDRPLESKRMENVQRSVKRWICKTLDEDSQNYTSRFIFSRS
jgi:hypothetical protein